MTAVKELRNKIADFISNVSMLSNEKCYTYANKILALLEQCPAMTIEDCPWGKKNVEFREIFLRGMNRQFEGIEVEEEQMFETGETAIFTRPATLEDGDSFRFPCKKGG